MPKQNISSLVRGAGMAASIWTALSEMVRGRGGTDDFIVGAGKVAKPRLLEFIGTITLPATTQPFVAADKFVEAASPVRISWLGSYFKEGFLGKTEGPTPKTTLRYAKLTQPEFDGRIIVELGEKAETTLAQIYALIERQPNGKEGVLLTNGEANIFCVRDVKSELRLLGVDWLGSGWDAGAYSVASPSGWVGGSRVFSRNSH